MTPFYRSQCTCNLYDSYHRYTRTIKIFYVYNSFKHMQKSATYATKSFQLPDPLTRGSAAGPRWGTAPRPHHLHPNTYYFPPNRRRLRCTTNISEMMTDTDNIGQTPSSLERYLVLFKTASTRQMRSPQFNKTIPHYASHAQSGRTTL